MNNNITNNNNDIDEDLNELMNELLKELPNDQKHLILKQVNDLKNSLNQNLIAPLLNIIDKQQEEKENK